MSNKFDYKTIHSPGVSVELATKTTIRFLSPQLEHLNSIFKMKRPPKAMRNVHKLKLMQLAIFFYTVFSWTQNEDF